MVKARRVKGLDADESISDNARKILATRLDELLSFAAFVDDPVSIVEIHNLRIAAKRLRYSLELFRFAFPAKTGGLIDEVKEIQEYIGEMNDADVMRQRVLETLNRDATNRLNRLVEIASASDRGTIHQRHQRLRSAMTSKSTPRDEVALLTLVAYRADDEHAAYQRFHAAWHKLLQSDFPGRLRRATGIDPEVDAEQLEAADDEEPASG
jgi:hypothetical protein